MLYHKEHGHKHVQTSKGNNHNFIPEPKKVFNFDEFFQNLLSKTSLSDKCLLLEANIKYLKNIDHVKKLIPVFEKTREYSILQNLLKTIENQPQTIN